MDRQITLAEIRWLAFNIEQSRPEARKWTSLRVKAEAAAGVREGRDTCGGPPWQRRLALRRYTKGQRTDRNHRWLPLITRVQGFGWCAGDRPSLAVQILQLWHCFPLRPTSSTRRTRRLTRFRGNSLPPHLDCTDYLFSGCTRSPFPPRYLFTLKLVSTNGRINSWRWFRKHWLSS